jgi:hypothetical protein
VIRRASIVTWLVLMSSSPAVAQVHAAVETGLGGVQAQSDPGAIAALGSSLSWASSAFRMSVEAAYTGFSADRQGMAGRTNLSAFARLLGPLTAEGFASATGLTGPRDVRGAWLAGARVHLLSGTQGLWLGGGRGSEPGSPTWRMDAGLWRDLGPFNLQLLAGQTLIQTSDRRVIVSSDTLTSDTVLSKRQQGRTDLSGWIRWAGGPLQLGVGVGHHGNITRPAEMWWESEAAWWMSPRLALVGSAGNRPSDLTLGMTGGRFVMVSLRASLGSRSPKLVAPRAPSANTGFRAQRMGDGMVEITLPGRGAHLVELMGDFTDWQPVTLEPTTMGWWKTSLPVTAGVHLVNVRFDGGAWEAPPGAAAVADEFGGITGRVVIR